MLTTIPDPETLMVSPSLNASGFNNVINGEISLSQSTRTTDGPTWRTASRTNELLDTITGCVSVLDVAALLTRLLGSLVDVMLTLEAADDADAEDCALLRGIKEVPKITAVVMNFLVGNNIFLNLSRTGLIGLTSLFKISSFVDVQERGDSDPLAAQNLVVNRKFECKKPFTSNR